MITEDFVSFETSKLLQEKGVEDDCEYTGWIGESGNYYFPDDTYLDDDEMIAAQKDRKEFIPLISLQMAMKWLREVHNKIIVPGISLDDRTSSTINHYNVGIWYIPENNGGAFCYTSPTPYDGYPSFEEACEAAIKYCLENLI